MTAHGARIRSTAATRWRRAAFVLPAALALLAGLDAALMLLGLRAPITVDRESGGPDRPPRDVVPGEPRHQGEQREPEERIAGAGPQQGGHDTGAVLRRQLPYHPAMIAPAALLHGSLALRLWAGDAHGAHLAWQVGGVLNITAALLFAGVAAWSSVRAAHGGVAS